MEKADKITKENKNDRKIVNFEIEINLEINQNKEEDMKENDIIKEIEDEK